MLRVGFFLVLLLCLEACLSVSAANVHIYVSPHGSDQNDGHSSKQPVQTIPQALTLAAQDKFNTSTVFIELLTGYYDHDKTLTIARNNIIIRAYRHQKVHVTGGYRIPSSSLKPVTDQAILSRLPASARTHIRVVNLHDLNITNWGTMDDFGTYKRRNSQLEVFFNGQPLHFAQFPNDGYLDIVDVPNGKDGTVFRYNSTVPKSWHGENDPWVYGFWYVGWSDKAIKVKSLDTARNTVTLEHKAPHGLRTGHLKEFQDGISNKEGGFFRFINILSALDEPGEFYMDRDSGKLYMWVPNQSGIVSASDMVYISMANDCIFIRPHTEDVHLQDFTLEYCRRSGIYTVDVNRIRLFRMEIRNTGGMAASFVGDSRQVTLTQCYIHDTCGGVSLYGGNRTTLESSGNTIESTEIARYSRVGVVGNDAITLGGVGHAAKYNNIHNGRTGAISFSGNDITMEHNLIQHVCKENVVCGAIHAGYDWTYRGNVIRYNIIHHTLNLTPGGSNKAVLLDGQLSGTRVMYNVLYDNTVHVSIGGGRYNEINNNVMFNASLRSIEVDNRGTGHYADATLLKNLHAMPYKGAVWALRYPHLAAIDTQNFSLPEGNQISQNIMHARPNTEYIHGIADFLKANLSRFFNITQTGFSLGITDHYSVQNGDLRVTCTASAWANHINFKQPPTPNNVGPLHSPVGPTYLHRGRIHLVNMSYHPKPCHSNGPPKSPPLPPYLPDGSHVNKLYPVERTGCWLNVTKCQDHPASVGTYRDMYGERYHNARDNETMCFKRAHEQWKMCGSHNYEMVAAVYGPTGATTLGGDGCMTAMYGCPKHGGPVDGHANMTFGKYQRDYNGERSHDEEGCLAHAVNIWRYCGSSPNYPITNVYLPTGAKRTAGGGCWISLESCPKHTHVKKLFYDSFGATNYQTDTSEFACLYQAAYYWFYCGANATYPVTATYRPTTASKTYP